MAYIGLGIQIFGLVLILVGSFKAARAMDAVERGWTGTKLWVRIAGGVISLLGTVLVLLAVTSG